MFQYPSQAAFNKVLPKSKIYAHAKPSRRVRDLFVTQVAEIVWKYKLAPETINLPARPGVPEIEVFEIVLKAPDLDEDVLRAIDKAIKFPIFYQLTHERRVKYVAAHKRPSDADSAKWVVDAYFSTGWTKKPGSGSSDSALPVALDLAGLYERMLRRHIDLPSRPKETLKAHVERICAIRGMETECARLATKLKKEQHFNRKVEINGELRRRQKKLLNLRDA